MSSESFADRHPGPEDILALVEVADSSLGYDRGAKLRVYAAAGVPVYVIANLPERMIERYEQPAPGQGRYEKRTDHRSGETLTLPLSGGKTLTLVVDEVLGAPSR